MRHSQGGVSSALLVALLALAGCGSSGSTTTTARQVAAIVLKSPAIGESLPARYTCEGNNISPPLEWGKVPVGTRSLALFEVALLPEPTTNSYKISVGWAVAGLNPALHKLAAGQLPPGAFLGVNSEGHQRYSMCPEKGTEVKVQFELYGLPASVVVARSFQGVPVVRELQSTGAPISSYGLLATTYKRS